MSHRFVLRPQTTAAHSSLCRHKDVPKDGRRLPFGCPVSKQKTRSPWRTRATGNWILYSQNKILFFILRFCLSLSKKSVWTFLTSLAGIKKEPLPRFFFYSFRSRYSAASALPFRKDGISGYSAGSVSPSRSFHTAAPAAVTRSATVCTPRTSRSSGSAA